METFTVVDRWLRPGVNLLCPISVGTIPDRDAMPPPDLTANAPVTEIVDPVEIRFLKPLRQYLDVSAADDVLHDSLEALFLPLPFDSWLVYVDKPLELYLRFDNPLASLVDRDAVGVVVVDGDEKPLALQLVDDLRSSFGNVHASELFCYVQKIPVKVYHLLLVQAVPLSYLEIRVIMPRCDGHNSGTELGINSFVLDDGSSDWAVDPLSFKRITVFVLSVALVTGVHDDVFVAKLRLWAGGADLERAVAEGIELRRFLDAFDFVIRDGRF